MPSQETRFVKVGRKMMWFCFDKAVPHLKRRDVFHHICAGAKVKTCKMKQYFKAELTNVSCVGSSLHHRVPVKNFYSFHSAQHQCHAIHSGSLLQYQCSSGPLDITLSVTLLTITITITWNIVDNPVEELCGSDEI